MIQNTDSFSLESLQGAIDILADLIDWNALDLFSGVIPLLEPFLANEKTKLNTMHCYSSIIVKGMDEQARIEAIKNIDFLGKLRTNDLEDPDIS